MSQLHYTEAEALDADINGLMAAAYFMSPKEKEDAPQPRRPSAADLDRWTERHNKTIALRGG